MKQAIYYRILVENNLFYIPQYRKGVNGKWKNFHRGLKTVELITWQSAMDFIREKLNYNDAAVLLQYVW